MDISLDYHTVVVYVAAWGAGAERCDDHDVIGLRRTSHQYGTVVHPESLVPRVLSHGVRQWVLVALPYEFVVAFCLQTKLLPWHG